MKRSSIVVLVILVLVVLGVGGYFLIRNLKKSKTVVVSNTTYPWKASVDKYYAGASQTEPNSNVKSLSDELTPIIKETLKADVKISESTDKKIVYVAKTIIVEGDVNSIKKALEAKGYTDAKITNNYKELSAKKGDRQITLNFSVDTVEKGRIELTLSP